MSAYSYQIAHLKPHLRSSSQRDKPRYRVGEVGCEGDNQTTKRTWNYQTYEKLDWLVSFGPILVQIDKYKSLLHCFGQLVVQFWQNLQKTRLVLLSVSFYCFFLFFFKFIFINFCLDKRLQNWTKEANVAKRPNWFGYFGSRSISMSYLYKLFSKNMKNVMKNMVKYNCQQVFKNHIQISK